MPSIGPLHTASAAVALTAGMVVIFRTKGTRSHRLTGWIYVASMIVLNATALMIYRLTGSFGPFHVAALLSMATVVAGLVPVIRRRSARWLEHHYHWMSFSYVGLVAAAVSEVTTRTLQIPFWWAVVVPSAIVLAGGWMIISQFRYRLERHRPE